MPSDTLANNLYVIVRLACGKCFRRGQCRLGQLAKRYGADIRHGEALPFLVGERLLWKRQRSFNDRICGAYYVDLRSPQPPDLPAARRAFKIVPGGKR
jgi:hypothetical protein